MTNQPLRQLIGISPDTRQWWAKRISGKNYIKSHKSII